MIEPLFHSSLDDVGERDDAKNFPILANKKRSPAPLRNLCYRMLHLSGNRMPMFLAILRNCVLCTFPNLDAVKVSSGHTGLRTEGDERWLVLAQVAPSDAVFLLRQHNDRAPFGSLVGQ